MKESEKQISMKANIGWLFRVLRPSTWLMILLFGCITIASFSSIATAYVLKFFVDIASNSTNLSWGEALGFSAAVIAVGALANVISHYLATCISSNSEKILKYKTINYVLSTPSDNIKLNKGELQTRLTSDIENISLFIPKFITEVAGNCILLVLTIIFMFKLNLTISFALLISLPLLILVLSLFNFPMESADKKRKEADDDNRGIIDDALSNADVIRGNKARPIILMKCSETFRLLAKRKNVFGAWEGLAFFVNNLLSTVMVIIVLGFGAYLVTKGKATLGTLIAIVQLLNYIVSPIGSISQQLSKIVQLDTSIKRINPIILQNDEGYGKMNSLSNPSDISALVADGICYKYSDDTIINDFSHIFLPSKIYVITGRNGSGKTTLLKIISDILINYNGKIIYSYNNGKNRERSVDEVSIMLASETPFRGTVLDNITLFDSKFENDAKKNVWVQKLLTSGDEPLTLERQVDKMTATVSSGEMKKISLARIAINAKKVVLLDEPSANLDNGTKLVLKEFIEYLKSDGHICIIVTHDSDLITIADHIISFNESCEKGN